MYNFIKELVPPFIHTLRWFSFKYGWKGNYTSFQEAQKKCTGYDENHILNRIKESTDQVRKGEAVYERDGVIYDEVAINFHLLSTLLFIAGRNQNKLTIIDFGGSLGTSYYQNIKYLAHLDELNWCIIEQENYVKEGRQSFENENVKFYNSMQDCLLANPNPDIVLLSSSLQYIEDPYKVLQQIQSFKIPYLMFDLIAFNHKPHDRITIQHVPPIFYGIKASYPCTFFSKDKLEKQMLVTYQKEFEFISEPQQYYINFMPFRYNGSLWKLSFKN